MQIQWEQITRLAPNEAALRNGKTLARKLVGLSRTQDDSLLFAACPGSGKEPYRVSIDFQGAEPVARCSCPSRQIPCKHALALLCAVADGAQPVVAELPEEVREKREKAEQRATKKASAAPAKPKKVNVSALKKKLQAQLETLAQTQTQVEEIARLGIASLSPHQLREYLSYADSLTGSYLPGVAAAYRDFLMPLLHLVARDETVAAQQLADLHSLLRRGQEHIKKRLEKEDCALDGESEWDERLGHAWQLEELRAAGRMQSDVSLLQLHFEQLDDPAAKQWIDQGVWFDLNTGELVRTQNFRPYRAVKHIAMEDSVESICTIPELYVYPGQNCPRARWSGEPVMRPCTEADLQTVCRAAKHFAELLPWARAQLRDPMVQELYALLRYDGIYRTETGYALGLETGLLPVQDDPLLEIVPECAVALVRLTGGEALTGTLLCLLHTQSRIRIA